MNRQPAWQAERLQAATRNAHPGKCPHCAAPTIRGLDADIAAFTATADAQPITVKQETEMRAAGLDTYDLVGRGSTQLWRRAERHLTADPQYPIHAEHRCAVAVQEPLTFGDAA